MGPEASIYDKNEALERLEGDAELFADMAKMFVDDSESYCAALEEALKSGDPAALRREAHTLKSLLATFSYEAGRVLAERLESLAASGSLDGTPALAVEVLVATRRLSEALANDIA
jgi:HPt (histidine-containing phosphotransfer) domain-containing protein